MTKKPLLAWCGEKKTFSPFLPSSLDGDRRSAGMNFADSSATLNSQKTLRHRQSRSSLTKIVAPHNVALVVFLLCLFGLGPVAEATSSQGCLLDETLCDADEACVQDGLFGQCYAAGTADAVPPILLDEDLTVQQKALLRLELERLADEGLDWRHDRSQCILAYFKISVSYDLNYDTEFCSVRNPGNILTLIQRIQNYLSEEEENANLAAAALEAAAASSAQAEEPIIVEEVPIVVENDDDKPVIIEDASNDDSPIQEAVVVDDETGDAVPVVLVDEELVEQVLQDAASDDKLLNEPIVVVDEDEVNNSTGLTEESMADGKKVEDRIPKDKRDTKVEEQKEAELSKDEDKQLNDFVSDILNKHETKIHELSTPQLEKLVTFIGTLQDTLENTQLKLDENEQKNQVVVNAEQEEIIPLTSELNAQQLLMKKDPEQFDNEDMGLANIEHKIVKGDVHLVEGNRVYIKIGKENITEDELYKLINYLDEKIAEPNNLYFNEFQYEDGQLSFHISKLDAIRLKNDKRVDSASRVARAVYKRRKDIQTLAGVQVDETGIGSGDDVLPVERNERDWLFIPILTVCAFTVTSLVIVMGMYMFKNRRRSFKGNLPEILDHLNGKSSTAYEELCRQRMNSQDVPLGVGKSASTSSWPDETLLQSCNLDISTGHVVLSFLQEYIDSPQKIAEQWDSVKDYTNANAETTIGESEENKNKNVDQSVLPYDETVVQLTGDHVGNGYINASKIHDSDLRQVAYIATQAPLENTVNDFWHCIWQQGITLIVNLCDQEDALKYQRYWPDEGSKTYGIFEVHLVSEHIWSEDYLVRSFYLKNTETNETRTVTQFHFLAWPENGVPTNIKSLLEFRRKVNKSYRGRASPVLVHCSTGTARTGAYCLIDVVVNRITKGAGIKELNIAGSLEHLRDQRMKLVGSLDQYKLAYSCVAEEVNALLKNLQQQQQ